MSGKPHAPAQPPADLARSPPRSGEEIELEPEEIHFYASMNELSADVARMLERSNEKRIWVRTVGGWHTSGILTFDPHSTIGQTIRLKTDQQGHNHCWIERITGLVLPPPAWLEDDTLQEDEQREPITLPLRRQGKRGP